MDTFVELLNGYFYHRFDLAVIILLVELIIQHGRTSLTFPRQCGRILTVCSRMFGQSLSIHIITEVFNPTCTITRFIIEWTLTVIDNTVQTCLFGFLQGYDTSHKQIIFCFGSLFFFGSEE